jgi:hypothetical protein
MILLMSIAYLFTAFVLGHDIKPERRAIHINLSVPWFLMNAIRALEPVGLYS